MIRTVFMGTPEFAVPSLQALLGDAAYEVVGVVTQPDREAGRGRKVQLSPVKQAAMATGATVLQPEKLKEPTAFSVLADLTPDLIVVAAYGQILRRPVLELPQYGCINVHASLLPRWRGASPISAAILAGDGATGVTIMRMDEGMDTGPILAQVDEPIRPDDTTGSLGERLARQGADLLLATLRDYLAGKLIPQPQPVEGVTLCRPLSKEEARIDWTLPSAAIERMVRAYDPWPGAFTVWRGEPLKIGRASVAAGQASPGLVVRHPAGAAVGTGDGLLVLETVQPAGKRMMGIREFLAGRGEFVGAELRPLDRRL